jgi:ABC-type transporter MlaC component
MRCLTLILAFFITLTVVKVTSAETGGGARSTVDHLAQITLQVISTMDREQGAREFAGSFEMAEFSKRCMIDHWSNLLKTQRDQFVDVFQCNLEHRLSSLITKPLQGRKIAYHIGKARRTDGREILVPVEVAIDDAKMQFLYWLVPTADGFKLIDYEADGVSLSRNYRGHFNYMMRKYGFDTLLKKMRSRFKECNAAGMTGNVSPGVDGGSVSSPSP